MTRKEMLERLEEGILKHVGLKLMALYVPISSDKWLSIINGENYAGN